jgi:hypothetical protein
MCKPTFLISKYLKRDSAMSVALHILQQLNPVIEYTANMLYKNVW